jgi:hypothetical protein
VGIRTRVAALRWLYVLTVVGGAAWVCATSGPGGIGILALGLFSARGWIKMRRASSRALRGPWQTREAGALRLDYPAEWELSVTQQDRNVCLDGPGVLLNLLHLPPLKAPEAEVLNRLQAPLRKTHRFREEREVFAQVAGIEVRGTESIATRFGEAGEVRTLIGRAPSGETLALMWWRDLSAAAAPLEKVLESVELDLPGA